MFDSINNGKYWDKGITLVGGCTKVSPGCHHCWSEAMAKRFHNQPYPFDGNLAMYWDRIKQLGTGKPKAWAIWNDLYHRDVPIAFIDDVMGRVSDCLGHVFMVLTKRADRMQLIQSRYHPWKNLWLGATTENQTMLDQRSPDLLDTPAAIRYLSLEPLLGPIDMSDYLYQDGTGWLDLLNWTIIGQETGPRARPAKTEWFMDVIDQCRAANVPIFVKAAPKGVPIIRELPI